MNLYYALTTYHLLCVILHRMVYGDKNSDLMISDLTVNYVKKQQALKKSGLFHDVFVFSDKTALSKRKRRGQYSLGIADQLIAENERVVKDLLPIDPASYENRYICADQFPLGIYLNANHYHYCFFEEGNGQQSRPEETIEHNIKEYDPYLYWIVKKLGLYGRNENIRNRYINFDAQQSNYHFDDKDVDFGVYSLIDQLSNKQKKQLKQIFAAPDLDFDSAEQQSVLFLPQHNFNLHIFNTEQQLYQSGLILDYFAPDLKVYIKPHPNDLYTNYHDLGGEVHMIPHTFPAELLPLYTEQKFKKGITAWSTSIQSLEPILSKTIRFTSKIDTDYPNMHRYYACCKMLDALCRNSKKPITVYTIGINEPLLQYMLSDSGAFKHTLSSIDTVSIVPKELPSINNPDPFFIVADDLTNLNFEQTATVREQLLKSSAKGIVFINSKDDFLFFDGTHYEVFSNLVPWIIQKELLFEPEFNSDISIDEESVWLYMKDKNERQAVSNLHYTKQLPYSKMITKVNMADDQYQLPSKQVVYRNIKMLEGILKATEQRVLVEMERNKELNEKNQQLQKQVEQLDHMIKQNRPSDELSKLEQESKKMQEEMRIYEKKMKNMELKRQLEQLKSNYNQASSKGAPPKKA